MKKSTNNPEKHKKTEKTISWLYIIFWFSFNIGLLVTAVIILGLASYKEDKLTCVVERLEDRSPCNLLITSAIISVICFIVSCTITAIQLILKCIE